MAQETKPGFEIVDIGLISESCIGDWDTRKHCSKQEITNYLLANLDWAAMDTIINGINKLTLHYTVDSAGNISNLRPSSPNESLQKACHGIGNSWPDKFKYLREDGLPIMGEYSSSFSFYF